MRDSERDRKLILQGNENDDSEEDSKILAENGSVNLSNILVIQSVYSRQINRQRILRCGLFGMITIKIGS